MAKTKTPTKRLSAKQIEADANRVMAGIGPTPDIELREGLMAAPFRPTSAGVVVIRDYVTYSAYDDPIEG